MRQEPAPGTARTGSAGDLIGSTFRPIARPVDARKATPKKLARFLHAKAIDRGGPGPLIATVWRLAHDWIYDKVRRW
jgi:hypothetical protein